MVLPVGAGLGLERRLDCGEMRAKAAQHLFQHAIPPDAQPLAQDLNIGVAVSDMPGEPRKLPAHQPPRSRPAPRACRQPG